MPTPVPQPTTTSTRLARDYRLSFSSSIGRCFRCGATARLIYAGERVRCPSCGVGELSCAALLAGKGERRPK